MPIFPFLFFLGGNAHPIQAEQGDFSLLFFLLFQYFFFFFSFFFLFLSPRRPCVRRYGDGGKTLSPFFSFFFITIRDWIFFPFLPLRVGWKLTCVFPLFPNLDFFFFFLDKATPTRVYGLMSVFLPFSSPPPFEANDPPLFFPLLPANAQRDRSNVRFFFFFFLR